MKQTHSDANVSTGNVKHFGENITEGRGVGLRAACVARRERALGHEDEPERCRLRDSWEATGSATGNTQTALGLMAFVFFEAL
ncbi:hypothetical protein EYF80_028824 [Liparis tanakae]|uniref:Uncharacterized protein n=1 Tax=Liparis tanakae TaxID=230148 RepID=A0A4Z2H7W6_9TELE|nr:hypothetical protein EYF80_028824 [Liparis tanakae]